MRLSLTLVSLSLLFASCAGAGAPWLALVVLGGLTAWLGLARAEGARDAAPDGPPTVDAASDWAVDGGGDGGPPGPDVHVGPCLSPEMQTCLCAASPEDHERPVDLPVLIGAGLLLAGRPRRRDEGPGELTERVLDRAQLPPDLVARIRADD